MNFRFTIYSTFCIFIHLFMFYYTIAFNLIYQKSSEALMESSMLSLFLDWFAIDIGTSIIQAALRLVAVKYHSLRYI